MKQCLKQLVLILVVLVFSSHHPYAGAPVIPKAPVFVKEPVGAINHAYASSFEAYKKAQKLHDLQLMAKWGTAKEQQRSREALQKIQQQALKQQLRQQTLQQQQSASVSLLTSQGAVKSKTNHKQPGKADRLMVVNINKASAGQLMAALIGVGEVKAQAIVDYRQANGSFKTLDDVLAVKGIGPATIAKNRERIRFE